MIHQIADGAAGAFLFAGLWAREGLKKLAVAAAGAALAVSNALDGPGDFGWAGFFGAASLALLVSAVADWAKARRTRGGAE
jgi:hypothetical protein